MRDASGGTAHGRVCVECVDVEGVWVSDVEVGLRIEQSTTFVRSSVHPSFCSAVCPSIRPSDRSILYLYCRVPLNFSTCTRTCTCTFALHPTCMSTLALHPPSE